jgi:hypothetical protein
MARGGAPADQRIAARAALISSIRSNNATGAAAVVTAQAVMAGVGVNTISAQNITDINAALVTTATALTACLTALNTSMPLTAE